MSSFLTPGRAGTALLSATLLWALASWATDTFSRQTCPADMVLLPAGRTVVGAHYLDLHLDPDYVGPDPMPLHGWIAPNPQRRRPTPAVCLDRREVRDERGEPVRDLSFSEAQALCAVRGGRVPSEAVWAAAAQGLRGWKFSYGDGHEPTRCDGTAAPAVEQPGCVSRQGIEALDSGLAEWTRTPWSGPWYAVDALRGGPEDGALVIRGGIPPEWSSPPSRALMRDRLRPEARHPSVGVRCAADPVRIWGRPASLPPRQDRSDWHR